jgi:hypothetical protein
MSRLPGGDEEIPERPLVKFDMGGAKKVWDPDEVAIN